jgi:drug/metabolite transporter (DMT)-like permease
LIALLNYGLRFIPSGRGALIFATFPLLTMLIAAALGYEHLTLMKTLGVFLTIAGVGIPRREGGATGKRRPRMAGRACGVRERAERSRV